MFIERLHPSDPQCRWDPVVAPVTDRHWCAIGNRRIQLVVDNGGTTAIRDTAREVRWLTPRGGTGAALIDGWGTDRARWPGQQAPPRTWGPTWTTIRCEHEGVVLERTVGVPEGEELCVVVHLRVTATPPRSVTITEEWQLAPGVELAGGDESGVEHDGFRTHRASWTLDAGPDPTDLWTTVGLSAIDDPARVWSASLDGLASRLPQAACDEVPALAREIPWHVALLTGGASVDEVLGGHTLDQGSAYSFDLGFNGAARDPLQHALPLVYTEPDLALSVLRNTCAWGGPDGELPYAIDPKKQPITGWFEPSDQALWSLWLASEYVAATDDLAALHQPAPFHPVHGAEAVPLVDHLIRQFRHFVDVVGTGEHGHVRIRNADWNDSALTLSGIDRATMQERGESVLNSAMAAWVLPRFAGLLRRLDRGAADGAVADEADARARQSRDLVAGEWNGRWYRRAYGPGAVVGDDELWLEVQPWAILCGAAGADRAAELVATIDELVRRHSPLGARLRGPVPIRVPDNRFAGEGTAGGVWPSINMTLAWSAARVDPALAWDELRRMTLDAHTRAYPGIWEGTISGPDAYNTVESPRPGSTWAWADRGIAMQSFPVNNLHAHAQVVFTYLRLLGIEPGPDGRLAAVAAPRGTFRSRTFEVGPDGWRRLRPSR